MRPAGAPEAGRRPRRGPVLRLKRGRERARSHPWIFKGDVADVSAVEPGAAGTVVDAAGGFVGRGGYNPRPGLCCPINRKRGGWGKRVDFGGRRIIKKKKKKDRRSR